MLMGFLEIEMPRLCDFQHLQRPVTLSFAMEMTPCYGTAKDFEELEKE